MQERCASAWYCIRCVLNLYAYTRQWVFWGGGGWTLELCPRLQQKPVPGVHQACLWTDDICVKLLPFARDLEWGVRLGAVSFYLMAHLGPCKDLLDISRSETQNPPSSVTVFEILLFGILWCLENIAHDSHSLESSGVFTIPPPTSPPPNLSFSLPPPSPPPMAPAEGEIVGCNPLSDRSQKYSIWLSIVTVQALESYIDLTLVEAVVMCLTRLQPLLRSVSWLAVSSSVCLSVGWWGGVGGGAWKVFRNGWIDWTVLFRKHLAVPGRWCWLRQAWTWE